MSNVEKKRKHKIDLKIIQLIFKKRENGKYFIIAATEYEVHTFIFYAGFIHMASVFRYTIQFDLIQ